MSEPSGGWPPPQQPPSGQPPAGAPGGWREPGPQPYQQGPYQQGSYPQGPYQQGPYQQGQQPGWGQPAWGPPAVPPKRSSTALIVGIVAGVLALVLVVAGGVLVLRSRLDGMSGSASAPSAISVPTWTNSAPSTGSSSGSPGSTSSADFLAILPEDFTDCVDDDLAGDGDTAAAQCGAAATQPGPAGAVFHQYPDADALDDVFVAGMKGDDLVDGGVPKLTQNQDCYGKTGWRGWSDTSTGAFGGELACVISDNGAAVLAWTDEQYGIAGVVAIQDGDRSDLDDLLDWWGDYGYYQD